ncbi:MAG TPA: exonuclease domain-containing protein [Anaerolineae bacterium]|nr:exonuclease domain-containing protein [Anaerolineae bacterium]
MATEQVPIDKATYVVLDLETTGTDHRTERIIEIGAVKMIGDLPTSTFEQLVNPNRVVPSGIIRLTGITNAMIYRAPDIKSVLPNLAAFIGDSILVVHNAPFDISFLNSAARSIGQKTFRNRFLDTRLIAQRLTPTLGFYRLANLAEHFNVPHRPRHRALPDALATAEVFAHLLEIMKRKGLGTVHEARRFFYPQKRYDFSHKKDLASALPRSSGVYLMRNGHGDVIYVGKAKDLKKRVRSYFYSGPRSERQHSLITDVTTIDYIKTGTEIGALLLESKLIKKFKPTYNVLGKQYHRYPFVHIDYNEEFPTPKIVRKVAGDGFYYGPFPNAADLELLLEVIKDLYGLKQCDYKVRLGKKKGPCFYYQVDRCSGPCSGMISAQKYRDRLAEVMDAFDGRPEGLRRELIRRRDNAAAKLHFEKAALFNRSLSSLEKTAKLLEGIRDARANLDFLLIEELACTSRIYLVANGQLTSCIDVKGNRKDITRLARKVAKIYFTRGNKTDRVTADQIENLSLFTTYFHKRPVSKVKVGASINDTVSSVLHILRTKLPCPSTGIDACSGSLPQSLTRSASHPPLSGMTQHS